MVVGHMHSQGGGGSSWHRAVGPLVLLGRKCSLEGGSSELHLHTGNTLVAVVCTASVVRDAGGLVPAPVAHVGSALMAERPRRKMLLWWTSPSPPTPPNNGTLPLWRAQVFSWTPLVVVHHTLDPSNCLRTATPSPLHRV